MTRQTDTGIDTPLEGVESQKLIAALLARKEPETCRALFQLAGNNQPSFVAEWHKTSKTVQDVVDDLYDVMEWLRDDKLFQQADRVRTLMARLAKSVPAHPVFSGNEKTLIRNLARDYPEQLTVKESKALRAALADMTAQRDAALAALKDAESTP